MSDEEKDKMSEEENLARELQTKSEKILESMQNLRVDLDTFRLFVVEVFRGRKSIEESGDVSCTCVSDSLDGLASAAFALTDTLGIYSESMSRRALVAIRHDTEQHAMREQVLDFVASMAPAPTPGTDYKPN